MWHTSSCECSKSTNSEGMDLSGTGNGYCARFMSSKCVVWASFACSAQNTFISWSISYIKRNDIELGEVRFYSFSFHFFLVLSSHVLSFFMNAIFVLYFPWLPVFCPKRSRAADHPCWQPQIYHITLSKGCLLRRHGLHKKHLPYVSI
ncbi:hypothetical protein TDB9533_00212 [Thalassocella blandensis]|nr:hypothetical protein TDB9533_00212 [Thalassocella blandensis]